MLPWRLDEGSRGPGREADGRMPRLPHPSASERGDRGRRRIRGLELGVEPGEAARGDGRLGDPRRSARASPRTPSSSRSRVPGAGRVRGDRPRDGRRVTSTTSGPPLGEPVSVFRLRRPPRTRAPPWAVPTPPASSGRSARASRGWKPGDEVGYSRLQSTSYSEERPRSHGLDPLAATEASRSLGLTRHLGVVRAVHQGPGPAASCRSRRTFRGWTPRPSGSTYFTAYRMLIDQLHVFRRATTC